METRVSSPTKEVIIGNDRPTVLIGERINPAGKKKLQEALKEGNLEIIRKEALDQIEAGADILDINVSMFGVDEKTLLPQAVQLVIETIDIPICLDSSDYHALEAALKICKGRPLINSVTGEERSLANILPLVKDYGVAVIGLVQDERGIPKDSERRVQIAHKIIERAEALGIASENIIIDCLACAVGADPNAGVTVIEAARKIKADLGVNLTLGASNISFGLPDRNLLNNAFIAMAILAGINCIIVDVAKAIPVVVAADLLLGRDRHARRYIGVYRQRQKRQQR